MKVTYKERNFIDKYRCVDKQVTRNFDKSWEVGGLTYFKQGSFTIFTVATNCIVNITQ